MGIAKVILNGVVQMDVTGDTVASSNLLSGYTATGADGESVSGGIATQAAQTIHPSTNDQTIASGKYLTGAQTIKAVTTTNLTSENIVSGVTVKVGDSTDDDCVASVTGTAETGGDDFIIAIELSTSSGKYEPYECTFETALAAYDAGKNIAFVLSQGAGDPVACAGAYYPSYNAFGYGIRIDTSGSNWTGVGEERYMWTSAGVTKVSTADYYSTSNATATPADVASGKVFYNADGRQTGTASGGGGGGISGVARGTLTVDATVSTSTKVDITTTTEIGFTPTKFFFFKDTHTGTDTVIYMSTYADIGGKYIRVRAVYDARDSKASVSGNYMTWTVDSSGYLYFGGDTVQISVSSSYKLEAGTYTWYAIA